jgi:hypothetical protein
MGAPSDLMFAPEADPRRYLVHSQPFAQAAFPSVLISDATPTFGGRLGVFPLMRST